LLRQVRARRNHWGAGHHECAQRAGCV
jgi:hypothetical protein